MLIIIVAAAARFHQIGRHSLWIDEIASVETSCGWRINTFELPRDQLIATSPNVTSARDRRPVSSVIDTLRSDTHPPLYVLCLRTWRVVFGDGDSAARSLSAACSLFSIVLLFDACRMLQGSRTALWASALMAVATPQIEFAQETRSYAMLTMWYLAAACATVRIDRLGFSRRRALGLFSALLAGALTHYYFAACFAGLGSYALVRMRKTPRASAAILICVSAAVVAFLVLNIGLLIAQRGNFHGNMTWIGDDPAGLPGRTLYRVASLPLRFFVAPLKSSLWIAPLSIVLLILPLVTLQRTPELLLWCLLAVAALALPMAADLFNHSQSIGLLRYTLPAAPALYALSAGLLNSRPGLQHLIPATLLGCCVLTLPQAYVQDNKPDWRGLAEAIARAGGTRNVLVFYQSDARDWYHPELRAGLTHYAGLDRWPVVILSKPASPDFLKTLSTAPQVWLITGSGKPPIDQLLPGAIPRRVIFDPVIGQALSMDFHPALPASNPFAPSPGG